MSGDITALFQTHVHNLRPSGANGQYTGLCPLHEDRQPSFSVNLDSGLWICHAGCGEGDAGTLAEKLGLDPRPFYQGGNGSPFPGNVASNPEKEAPLPERELSNEDKRKAMGFHKYLLEHHRGLNEAGKIPRCWTLEVIKKTFSGYDPDVQAITFIHTNQDGQAVNIRWHKSAIGAPPRSVPAHGQTRIFPAYVVAKYETDWLLYVEGEKDVLTALSMGLPAFTFTNGSGKLPLDLSLPRQVKKIVLLPDHDESGYTGVGRIARGISAAYQDTEILICRWPDGTSADEDLTSYRELGGTIDNFALKILGDASPPKSTPTPEPRVFELFSPRIDLDRLTPALQEFLSQVALTTDSPDEFLIAAYLIHWAGVVGNKLLGPDRLRPNIWTVLFAGSSEVRKSTALSLAGRSFKVIQKRFDAGLKESWVEYKKDLLRWEGLQKAQRAEVREPEKPIAQNLLLPTDFSDAGFYMVLKQNPASGVIVASEFADFHKKLNRDFTSQADAFLAAYDNERMSRQTRRHELEVIEEPTFSILGATTFENFRRVFRASEMETGFFQRIFPVAVPAPTKERILFLQRSEMEQEYIQGEANHIKAWLDCPGDLEVEIPPDIAEAFNSWESKILAEAKGRYGERIGPHLERMVPGCLKLAMLCESIEVNDPAGQANLILSIESLLCAQMLVENLFLPSVNYLLEEEIIYGRERMNEKRIERALKVAGGTMDRTALIRETRLSSKELDEAICTLQDKGLLKVSSEHQERKQGGGNPRLIYIWGGE